MGAVVVTAVLAAAAPRAEAHGGGGGGGSIPSEGAAACVDGMAGSFPCRQVDLGAWLSVADIGGGTGNDVWGWRHGGSGREFALMGRSSGTAFVEVTDPFAPVYLGDLPAHGANSIWRDIKVYADHALIVSEANAHGLQVFDLTALLAVGTPPVTFVETAHFPGFGHAHNVAINETTGYAYAVGSDECAGGLYIIDVSAPAAPVLAGCFGADGYTHDVQCVLYTGPDAAYVGREICLAANEDSLTIVDVTDKGAPVQVSRTEYLGRGYTHQAWFTDDQAWILLDDESDELIYKHNARTYVVDATDLDAPVFSAIYTSGLPVIDHNQYVVGSVAYQAQYTGGLRLLDLTDIGVGPLCELGYLDVYPDGNERTFDGAWSVYPFFPSGTVLIGAREGLGIALPDLGGAVCPADPPIVQNQRQARCINALNKAGLKVAQTQGKEADRCIKDASRQKIPDAQACLTGDLKEKVLKARLRTLGLESKRCLEDPPTIGYTSGTALNDAAVTHETALWQDVYGPDLQAAVILKTDDAVGASCQSTVARFYDKVMQARLKAFTDCKKTGLKLAAIVSVATLEACFDEMLADVKGKVAKARTRFASKVTAKCAGVDRDAAFPGACVGAGDFATCVDERGACRACLLLNGMDGLARDCDLLDDGVADASCPP
jgi:choice-of-anchor B domain-containing protein